VNGYRVKWNDFNDLVSLLAQAREEGLDALSDCAHSLAQDFRDHLDEHGKRRVQGYCPMGCGKTLYLASQGVVECVKPDCLDPVAVTGLLWDSETEHLVHFEDDGWQAKHPMRERLGDKLLRCDIGEAVITMLKFPVKPAIYRVRRSAVHSNTWSWEAIS